MPTILVMIIQAHKGRGGGGGGGSGCCSLNPFVGSDHLGLVDFTPLCKQAIKFVKAVVSGQPWSEI